MQKTEAQTASRKIKLLQTKYKVDIISDWGQTRGNWRKGSWSLDELKKLENAIELMAISMGGADLFIRALGGVKINKSDLGTHGGEAMKHQISLSTRGTFSAWTVVHEMAHAWDANHGWNLSHALERYTGGFTNPLFSKIIKYFGIWDAGPRNDENLPGRHGRFRGCNAAGYFYGDRPSGSNWNFNRKEDFAESVAMYIGWTGDNELSLWSKARINRYLLENGVRDKNFGLDNWSDYRKYFYPMGGDYATTKRWKFVDNLMRGFL